MAKTHELTGGEKWLVYCYSHDFCPRAVSGPLPSRLRVLIFLSLSWSHMTDQFQLRSRSVSDVCHLWARVFNVLSRSSRVFFLLAQWLAALEMVVAVLVSEVLRRSKVPCSPMEDMFIEATEIVGTVCYPSIALPILTDTPSKSSTLVLRYSRRLGQIKLERLSEAPSDSG